MMLILSLNHMNVGVHIQTIIAMNLKNWENFQVYHSYKEQEKDKIKLYS